ncbi:hypothetical protein Xoosp13_336 [Xanthomonas phage Xoo-sp13]|nr:hypothetical protein Xoosp13_336 [Xanthomonas phage Xoo-sp13]
MIKALPKHTDGYRKVKVRKRKIKEEFEKTFNDSFFTEFNDIRNRAVFVNGTQNATEDTELFYIFPIDGYRFMYSPEVFNSTELYKDTFDRLIRTAGKNDGMDIFQEILQLSYTYDDLAKGIDIGCEIIIYDISHYYAIRKSLVDDYSNMFYNR